MPQEMVAADMQGQAAGPNHMARWESMSDAAPADNHQVAGGPKAVRDPRAGPGSQRRPGTSESAAVMTRMMTPAASHGHSCGPGDAPEPKSFPASAVPPPGLGHSDRVGPGPDRGSAGIIVPSE